MVCQSCQYIAGDDGMIRRWFSLGILREDKPGTDRGYSGGRNKRRGTLWMDDLVWNGMKNDDYRITGGHGSRRQVTKTLKDKDSDR